MNEKITSFKLTWHNWGLIGPNSVSKEEIILKRHQEHFVYKKHGCCNQVYLNATIHVAPYKINNFFEFLDSIYNEWEKDYSIPICDGSAWDIQIEDISHNCTQIRGTVEYPPHGKAIEKHIREFIRDAHGEIKPRLFGCH